MSLFQGRISELKKIYLVLHLYSKPEGDIGEVRERENVEQEDEEDPDWIEGEGTEVSTSESEMENENTDDDISVEPVPSTSHAPGMFYNPATSHCPPRAKRVPPSRGTRGFRGARAGALVARGSARGRAGRREMTCAPPGSQDTYKSYDDEGEGNPLDYFPPPPFTSQVKTAAIDAELMATPNSKTVCLSMRRFTWSSHVLPRARHLSFVIV